VAPWPEVFSLMWEAYLAGTIPVGAVVVDETGEVASRARNRTFDDPRDGHLGGSRLAHAEVNALVARRQSEPTRVSPSTPLWSHVISACRRRSRCVSEACATGAPDPQAGAVGKLVPSRDHAAHPLNVEGPLSGAPGRLAELLHVAHSLWRSPDGGVASFYRSFRPDLVAAAQTLPALDSGATLADAFAALNR
jgi:tRNA(adenine34) deaminase